MKQHTSEITSEFQIPEFVPPNRFQRVKNWLWGYDFFVSYHWSSGGTYAVNLAQRLRDKKYDVFLDRNEFARGDNWETVGRLSLANTRRLVVIATREAVTNSKPVQIEVTQFTRRDGHIIAVVFGDGLEDLDRAQYPTLACISKSKLHIEDSKESLSTGPSRETVDEIIRSHGITRRRTIRSRIAFASIAVLAFAVIVTGWFWDKAKHEARESNRRSILLLSQSLSANAHLLQGTVSAAEYPAERDDELAVLAARLAYKFNQKAGGEQSSAVDSALRRVLEANDFSVNLEGHSAPSFATQWPRMLTQTTNGSVLWNIDRLPPRGILTNKLGLASSIEISPSGESALGVWGSNVVLLRFDIPKALTSIINLGSNGTCVAFSSDGSTFAYGCGDGSLRVSAISDPLTQRSISPHNRRITALAFAPEQKILICGAEDGEISFILIDSDLRKVGKISAPSFASERGVAVLAIERERSVMAVGYWDAPLSVYYFDFKDDEVSTWQFWTQRISNGCHSISFNNTGTSLATGAYYQNDYSIWSLDTARIQEKFDASRTIHHMDNLYANVGFSPDGRFLAVTEFDREDKARVRLFCLTKPIDDCIAVHRIPSIRDDSLFSKDRRRLALQNNDGSFKAQILSNDVVIVQDSNSGDQQSLVGTARCIAFSRSGRLLAAASEMGIDVFQLHPQNDSGPVWQRRPALHVTPADARLAETIAISDDGNDVTWATSIGEVYRRIISEQNTFSPIYLNNKNHLSHLQDVALSSSGNKIAYVLNDPSGEITVRDLRRNSSEVKLVGGHRRGEIRCLSFDRTEERLASGDVDGRICVWNLQDPNSPPIVIDTTDREGFKTMLIDISFSPSGDWVFGGRHQGGVGAWPLTSVLYDWSARYVMRDKLTPIEWRSLVGNIAKQE